jgi:uncharacterized protein (UPF0276 family)
MSGTPFRPLPPRGGIGLKPAHFGDVLAAAERGAGPHWVEIHPQNYMMSGGPMHRWLGAIAESLPVSMHSVGLSLGDPCGVDRDELERLALLVDRYRPATVSDHVSWSSLDGEIVPDLLPMPMTRASLDHLVEQVSVVQDRLARPILVENPSRLLAFSGDDYAEPDFLAELCRRAGCGLLLDVNNVIVSAINLRFDPAQYLDVIDPALVGEIHVAGHTVEHHEGGLAIAIDDHGSSVSDQCWDLLDRFIARAGPRPVLVERDNDVPAYADLAAEVARADTLLHRELSHAA